MPPTRCACTNYGSRATRSGAAAVKAGIVDPNTEFDVQEAGLLFLGNAYGIGTDIGQTGENGPSIFPQPGLAVIAPAPRPRARRPQASARRRGFRPSPQYIIDSGGHPAVRDALAVGVRWTIAFPGDAPTPTSP